MIGETEITSAEVENWALANLSPEAAEIELWRRWMRHMCRTNIWFLAKEVLGYSEMSEDFHLRMCRRLNRWPTDDQGKPIKMTFDAWPRGGFKTTLATATRSMQMVLRCPEETILIEHGTDDGAVKIGGEIRSHFESNILLQWLFPDIIWQENDSIPVGAKWTQNELTLKRKGRWKEATFTFASYETETTGGHFTKIFFDDLVCEGNVGTIESMDAVHEHWNKSFFKWDRRDKETMRRFAYPWLKPDFEVVFGVANVFTRWDIRDSNSRVIDATNPEHENYKDQISVHIEKAIHDDGTSFFPSRFPLAELEAMRLRMGDAMFSAQMQQNPYPPGTQVFNPKNLQRWTENTLPKFLWYYTAVDPNGVPQDGSQHGLGDCGVVMTIGVSPLGNIYIMRIDRKRFSPSEQIKALINHVTLFHPRQIVIESTAYQATFAHWLKETTRNIDIHLPVVQRPRGGPESKLRRIMSIDPHWSSKRIVINPSEPNVKEFVAEASRWTGKKADQDDMLDALADCIAFMKKPPLVGEDRARAVKEGLVEEPKKEDQRQTGRAILGMLEKQAVPRRNVAELKRQRMLRTMKSKPLWGHKPIGGMSWD